MPFIVVNVQLVFSLNYKKGSRDGFKGHLYPNDFEKQKLKSYAAFRNWIKNVSKVTGIIFQSKTSI